MKLTVPIPTIIVTAVKKNLNIYKIVNIVYFIDFIAFSVRIILCRTIRAVNNIIQLVHIH